MQRFEVVLADPPWSESGGGRIKRGADRHYDLMTTDAIAALAPKVREIAADDAFLFLWVTDTFLPDGLRVLSEWGFTYKRTFIWCKDSFGLGFYARGQHEICLLGVRGKPARSRRALIHGTSYEVVESFGGSYCELFARRRRTGWVSYGSELGTVL